VEERRPQWSTVKSSQSSSCSGQGSDLAWGIDPIYDQWRRERQSTTRQVLFRPILEIDENQPSRQHESPSYANSGGRSGFSSQASRGGPSSWRAVSTAHHPSGRVIERIDRGATPGCREVRESCPALREEMSRKDKSKKDQKDSHLASQVKGATYEVLPLPGFRRR
jgi:hypothetical protein